MGKGTLTIYSASAGSGKTHKLTGIYLETLFKSRYNYRKILAVTFTNKATAEMKSRILDNLHKLAVGEKSEYLNDLIISSDKPEAWIRAEATGIALTMVNPDDMDKFNKIEKLIGQLVFKIPLPLELGEGPKWELGKYKPNPRFGKKRTFRK